MSNECVICRGDRFVRLPVYHPISARYDASAAISMKAEESYRTYPCPQCNEKTAAEERVDIVYATEEFKRAPVPAGAKQDVAHSLSRAIADHLLRKGLIEISEEKRGDDTLFIAKCAVVNPRVATRIERRAVDMMKKFLGNVADRAAEHIAVWGSHYTGNEGMISKGQAIDYMRAAFRKQIEDAEAKDV
ncbi:MAG: hypothetical protein AAAB13_20485 [Pseudomonas sp.]